MFIDVNRTKSFSFQRTLELLIKPKTNHENKTAKMNNQTKLLLLIWIKKYLQTEELQL